ncbi:O-antigen/teichoic acid export membrane protein [Bradyrhizobium sp. USDA 313]
MIEAILQFMRRDVTRGVAGTILLKVGSGVLAFALFSLAARTMSPDGFGIFATWLSVAQIAAVLGLVGQESLLVRFLNEYQVSDRPDLTKGVLLSSFKIASVAMLIVIAGIAIVASMRGDWWLLILAVSAYTAVNAAVMLGSQIARSLVSILMGEGNREFFWRVIVVLFLLVMLLGYRQLDPAELFAVMTIAMSVGLAAQIISIARVLPDLRDTPARTETSRWRSSALHFWLASILEAANQYFDVILVYWMLDPATAGIYFAASRLANIFAMLSAALYTLRRAPASVVVFQQELPGVRADVAADGGSDRALRCRGSRHDLDRRPLSPQSVRASFHRAALGVDRARNRNCHPGGRRPVCCDPAADRP